MKIDHFHGRSDRFIDRLPGTFWFFFWRHLATDRSTHVLLNESISDVSDGRKNVFRFDPLLARYEEMERPPLRIFSKVHSDRWNRIAIVEKCSPLGGQNELLRWFIGFHLPRGLASLIGRFEGQLRYMDRVDHVKMALNEIKRAGLDGRKKVVLQYAVMAIWWLVVLRLLLAPGRGSICLC